MGSDRYKSVKLKIEIHPLAMARSRRKFQHGKDDRPSSKEHQRRRHYADGSADGLDRMHLSSPRGAGTGYYCYITEEHWKAPGVSADG
jgi:hypothetical protein